MSSLARSREGNSRLVYSNGDLFFTGVAGFGLSVLALIASRWGGFAASGVFFVGSLALAEFATRSRRMAVSSTLLFLTYLWSIHYALDLAVDLLRRDNLAPSLVLNGLIATTLLAATWLHWARYRVPAAAGASAVIVILWLISLQGPFLEPHGWERRLFYPPWAFVILVAGISVLVIATFLDLRDPERHTFNSDFAIWMHLVAAFFVIGLVFWILAYVSVFPGIGVPTPWQGLEAVFFLTIFVLLSVFSLAINRSIYFVFSCLFFVRFYIPMMIFLLPDSFASGTVFFISCGLFVGLLLTWRTARSRVLKCLPARIRTRLPAIEQPFALSFLLDPRTYRAGKSGHSD